MGVALQPGLTTEDELQRLRTLYDLLAALTRSTTPDEVYQVALTSLLAATGADRAAILFADAQGSMRFAAWRGLSEEYREAVSGHSPWTPGTRGASPIAIRDVLADRDLEPYRDLMRSEGIRSVVFLPLSGQDGVFGKCMLYFGEVHSLTSEELGFAQTIAGHVALATERQRLMSASAHLANIVTSSDDAIVSKDLNGIITSWNVGAQRLFGYTAAQAVGQPISMLAVPGHENEMPPILESIRRGERVDHYETRRRAKDGRIIDVALTVSPVRSPTGEIVGASKIVHDISDRKRAEMERSVIQEREQAARTTAELLNRVGPLLLEQRDLEKLTQSVTDIATALVGAEFGAFFHNAVNEKGESYALYTLSGVPREAFEKFPMPGNTVLFGPTFRGEGIVRCEDVTKDARYGKSAPHYGMPPGHLPVRSYLAAPVVSRTGEVLGGLFFGHSLPGRFNETHEATLLGIAAQASIAMDNARLFEQAHLAQQQLRRSNEELRRANHDLETFVYSASHDLREPLHTIALCAQLLERTQGNRLEGDSATFLQRIRRGVDRLERLLSDLLAYTTATKGAEGPTTMVDAQTAVGNAIEALKGTIEESGARVTWDKLPSVLVHESGLTQVFQNLISNAVKYRKESPRVHISATEEDGRTVFCVRDNGIGIPQQYAEQIFGLFRRLHSRDTYPGSGIGLTICQRILEHYNGRIWLERSEPGDGSTFCFSIPDRESDR
jgi:PAS domain S-box-containing protein